MKYIRAIALIGIMLVAFYAYNEHKKAVKYQAEYIRMTDNVKAYELNNSILQDKNKLFKLTIDELLQSNDSINKKLLDTANKLKIKEKNIEAMQYHSTVITKTDTIVVNDTIFKDNTIDIDTVIGDRWYALNLGLKYPSTIVATPSFVSEKYIIVHKKKEYNKPPSKIFFIRWFQKKHWVNLDLLRL